jgi:hypothetical protein
MSGTTILVAFLLTSGDDELLLRSREESRAEYGRAVVPFLQKHCNDCHRPGDAEAGLVLTQLDPDFTSSDALRWTAVFEKITSGEMPPGRKNRPPETELKVVVRWIRAEAKRSGKEIVRPREPAHGNLVPHDLLFGTTSAAPFDAPARLRPFSPEIYKEWYWTVSRVGSGPMPFSAGGRSDFKDMGSPKVDEPTTTELLDGALGIAAAQTSGPRAVKELAVLVDPKVELTRERMAAGITAEFKIALLRAPTAPELDRWIPFMEKNVKEAGRTSGVRYALAAVFLLPEAFLRREIGAGAPDGSGRVRLTRREIAFALAFALTDRRPDAALLREMEEGTFDTADGVARSVRRMLDDPKLERPRILRFFQQYFEYPRVATVFKDQRETVGFGFIFSAGSLIRDTDRLVQHVLAQDRQVLRELLTTPKSFPDYQAGAGRSKALAEFESKSAELKESDPEQYRKKRKEVVGGLYQVKAYNLEPWPPEIFVPSVQEQKPVELPRDQRAGILTQPAWLAAFSSNDDNDAVRRGKWIRERLLGGAVPEVPITVNAQLPNEPHRTLRDRMRVTREPYCWKCHQQMDPLGLPFQQFNHLGAFRTEEVKPHHTKTPLLKAPLDTTGEITRSGDPALDGTVSNAIEMIHKLAASERVEQVFVRYAFRYWMGRNETLGDGPSLRAAHQAYRQSGGSMKSLIAALLSSDSFLYRVPVKEMGR